MNNLAKKLVKKLIFMYQYGYSRYKTPCCRYIPTCSCYAIEAIDKYGVIKGSYLAIKRIGRCNPFTKRGFYDPVP
ncbi:MAG: membrane protein insertion efficiency factor YidD [Clostridia bacterium]